MIKFFIAFLFMEETVTTKSSFDSFDADFIKGFDFDGKMEDYDQKCATTQECTDYQKVSFEMIFCSQVIFMFIFRKLENDYFISLINFRQKIKEIFYRCFC